MRGPSDVSAAASLGSVDTGLGDPEWDAHDREHHQHSPYGIADGQLEAGQKQPDQIEQHAEPAFNPIRLSPGVRRGRDDIA